jgi:hypothetical protein
LPLASVVGVPPPSGTLITELTPAPV